MKTKVIVVLVIVLGLASLNAQSKKEQRKIVQEKEYQETKKLMKSNEFEFVAEWTSVPSRGSINLAGDSYYIRIIGDRVFTDLPYFGVRTSGAGYGGRGGIHLESKIENYSIEYDDRKQKILIKFKAKDKVEIFDFYMTVFREGYTSVSVSGSTRSSITYNGRMFALNQNKKEKEGANNK